MGLLKLHFRITETKLPAQEKGTAAGSTQQGPGPAARWEGASRARGAQNMLREALLFSWRE